MKKLTAQTNLQRGFTLVETLVAFSIISIVTGVTIIGFSNYNKGQLLSQTATNIELLISQARGNAQSVVKTINDQGGVSRSCNNDKLKSYKVTRTSSSAIKLDIICVNSIPTPPTYFHTIRTITLPSSDMSLSTSCNSVEFDSLDAKATLDPVTPPCEFVLSQGSAFKRIIVDNYGNVEVQ